MAEPIITQRFTIAQGLNEGVNVVALPDSFSSGDAQNITFDKLGKIQKVAGYTARPSSAVTTNGGGATTQVHALFPYWSGASFPAVVAVFHDGSFYDLSDDEKIYDTLITGDTPTAYYRLGESAGTTATDEMGSFDGTYVNTPTLGVAGITSDGDTAVTFTAASSEHVTTPLDETDITNTGWSLEAWVKTSTTSGAIITRFNSRPQLSVLNNNAHVDSFDGTVSKSVNGTTTITDNEWHHVAATYDGTTLRLYVDGASEGTPVAANGYDDAASAVFLVGARADASNYFDGTMDEVTFYNSALTATQIAEHYTSGSQACREYEIHTSADNGVSFTFRKDLGGHSTANFRPLPTSFEYNDILYMTFAGEAVQQWDGSSVTDAGPSQSPTPTLSASATAGKPSGTYQCRLVSMKDQDRQAGSVASSEVQLDSKQGSVSWTADSDTAVTGYEVYFTTGTGKEFYFVGYVDGRTTVAFTLDLSDPEIRRGRPLDRHGDAPPSGVKVCALHKNRGWYANSAANPSRLWFSDPFEPAEVSPNSFFDVVGDVRGEDAVTALVGGYFGSLVVFKEHSIFRVTGSGEYFEGVPDFTVLETNASIGAPGSRGWARIPAGATYPTASGQPATTSAVTLVFYAGDQTIRIFDGDVDVDISFPIRDLLNDVHRYSDWLVWAEHDEENQEVTWYYADTTGLTAGEDQQADRGVTWNYRWGTWSLVTDRPFSAGYTGKTSDGTQIMFAGSNGTGGPATGSANGKIYVTRTGTHLNGVGNDIEAHWFTKPLVGADEDGASAFGKSKRWRRVRLVTDDLASNQSLTVSWYTNWASSGATAFGTNTVEMNAGTNLTHGEAKVLLKSTNGDYPVSKALRIKMGDDADDAAWSLVAFEVDYQILQGDKGR